MGTEASLSLFSAYENIELAEKVLFEFTRGKVDEEETLYWVAMALREALANAIKHGNKLNPKKRVFVNFQLEGKRLTLTVEDEGEGFDPAHLADPCSPENLLKDSGRGVFYIQHFMEEVSYAHSSKGGTILRMSKVLQKGGQDEVDVP